ncbi:hypothetical protein WR25_09562 isoform C [Diploscapter pachys]|uniref:Protein-serine O-palmitoleoyltransferase porcupine n=1 Tax=Diploscapter pachys TaxID=2018661 RepID=A0A2A2KX16_9BILA|nr:hypothetical protein WR25_09562 isoform C [Diploscapter pachys]
MKNARSYSDDAQISILCATTYTLFFNFYFRQWITSAKVFTQHRGLLMILAMKLSALAFDSQNIVHDPVLAFTYLFNPATVIFGPFVSYRDYVDSFRRKGGFWPEVENIWNAVYSLLMAGIWVLTSSCADTIIPNASQNQQAFNTAFSFRSSHYFISYLSQALAILAGYNLVVTRPLEVELPRSIGALVTSWNVPMHDYLKKYIYKKFITSGPFIAILATFGISSLLHGINAQFSLVLLTLGFNAYFEAQLRDSLARLLGNVDIGARSERYRKQNVISHGINFLFMLLNIHQLIYLGMPFVSKLQDTGYHWEHTLASWERYRYCGHIVIATQAILSFLLQFPANYRKWRR